MTAHAVDAMLREHVVILGWFGRQPVGCERSLI